MCKYKIRLSHSFIEDLKRFMIGVSALAILGLVTTIASFILGICILYMFPQVENLLNHDLTQYGKYFGAGFSGIIILLIAFASIMIPRDDYREKKRFYDFRQEHINDEPVEYSLKQYFLDKLSFMIVCETTVIKSEKRGSGETSD